MTRELVSIQTGTYAVRRADVAYARHSWVAERLAACDDKPSYSLSGILRRRL